LYLYPADASCFNPTGGLTTGYSYSISILNATAINVTRFIDDACADYSNDWVYAIDTCVSSSDEQYSVFETMPSDDYWIDQAYVGAFGPWETALALDYYNSACESDSWINREIVGWEQCDAGVYFYCKDDEIHYDVCTDVDSCDSGCTQVYQPLADTCTTSANAPTYWDSYIDDSGYNSYQATCVSVSNDGSSSVEFSSVSMLLLIGAVLLAH